MGPATGTVTVVALDALDDGDLEAWHRLRNANPALDSPYFHPEFARAVHESGTPVDVVVERDENGVRNLLAGHRLGSVFRPVGWPGADFQGLIGRGDEPIHALRLLRATGMRGLEFDHLLEVPGFEPWIESRRRSPYVDVAGGLDAYLGRASKSGRDNMRQARRKARKAETAYGSLRFEPEGRDADMLDAVIALKRTQYAATGARDYFAAPERVALLQRLLQTSVDGFGGVLSTVHVRTAAARGTFWDPVRRRAALVVPGVRPGAGRVRSGLDPAARAHSGRACARTDADRPRTGRRRVQAPCKDRRDRRV